MISGLTYFAIASPSSSTQKLALRVSDSSHFKVIGSKLVDANILWRFKMKKNERYAGEVVVVGSFPKLQRVLQYDMLSQLLNNNLTVFYLRSMPFGRHWKVKEDIGHKHKIFKELRIYRHFYLNLGFFMHVFCIRPKLVIFAQYATLSSFFFAIVCILRGTPFVLWAERPGVSTHKKTGLFKYFFIKTIRSILLFPFNFGASEIWPVGPLGEEAYRTLLRRQKTFTVMPLPLNLEDYSSVNDSVHMDEDPETSCTKYIFVGELNTRKGFDIVIDAFDLLRSESIDFRLDVYGAGILQNRIVKLAQQDSRIKYHGFMELKQVPTAYRSADIALCPSRHDGWGNNVIEALASGSSVIGSNSIESAVHSVSDLNGYTLSTLTYQAMAELIVEISKDRAGLNRRKENAKLSVENLSFYCISKLMKSRIDSIVGSKM